MRQPVALLSVAIVAVLALVVASIWGLPRPWEAIRSEPPVLVPESGPSLPLRERMGVNVVYANEPTEIAQVAGWARDYHRWYWYEPERGRLTWSSSKQRLDRFYSSLNRLDTKLLVNVGMVPSWASSNGRRDGLPHLRGRSGTAPEDYLAHGEYLAQLAARYGSARHQEGLLSPDRLSGQGWVQAIEGWNEPNQDWAEPRFPPSQFAKLLEVDYDGSGIGPDAGRGLVGIKGGDPEMLAVLPGLAGPDLSYLEQTLANRARRDKLPFDVLSFHWYAKGDGQGGGRAPEAAGLVETLQRVRRWRDSSAPGVPIWLTELGWDTNSRVSTGHSSLYAPETTAAAYLVRALFLSLANGVDKLFLFTYRDHDSESPELYSSSGLVENSSADEGLDARKKAGWYYLATIKRLLGNMVMVGVDRQGDGEPSVYLYRLAEPGGNRMAAVAWVRNPRSPRDDGTTTPGHEIPLPYALRADRIDLAMGSSAGVASPLSLTEPGSAQARVNVPLREVPVVVEYWVKQGDHRP